jgi:chemotaxis signal transduction protein
MSETAPRTPRRWLTPSAALERFQPQGNLVAETAPAERARTRYGFRLGDLGLLIERNTTCELLEQMPVYPVPGTPAWLRGLINLRGNLVPVFDPASLLGLDGDAAPVRRWLLVLDRGEQAVGLFIDHWPQPVVVRQALPRLPPLPAALQPYIAAGYIQDDRIWLEFDHRGFFRTLGGQVAGMT